MYKRQVPYLPIDPKDVGREYESDVIRINSQSGKGGIGYLLEQNYGYDLPPKMREDFGYAVKSISDHQHKELKPSEVHSIFKDMYINISSPMEVMETHFAQNGRIHSFVKVKDHGQVKNLEADGNGRLDAVSNAFKSCLGLNYTIVTYKEHALERGSGSKAVAYVGIADANGKVTWGAGVHNDIITASVNALLSAINRMYGENN